MFVSVTGLMLLAAISRAYSTATGFASLIVTPVGVGAAAAGPAGIIVHLRQPVAAMRSAARNIGPP